MSTLFDDAAREAAQRVAPLAVRMRPRTLDEFLGQSDAVGTGSWLRAAIEHDTLSSVILFGPAGTGKTSLARIVAAHSQARFIELSAVTAGVADIRAAIERAQADLGMTGARTIVFIDEIHRFSRSQQDALLHAVEDGIITLIGATTENPFFEVNAPLVSRSRIIEFSELSDEDVRAVLTRAIADDRGLADAVVLESEAQEILVSMSGGDARVALTTLEIAADCARARGEAPPVVRADDVRSALPTRMLVHDKSGDMHYDVVSAFIKSMRGGDPDAAVYWMARMIQGGEDPKFIARRILICASEDVGTADPTALLVAHAASHAAQTVGLPECRIVLAHAAIHVALAPKSNACYLAIDAALADVRQGPARAVPSHLRDRHRPGAENYGPYRYPHDSPSGWVDQVYLPDGLKPGDFYRPTERDSGVRSGKLIESDSEDGGTA